MSLFPWRSLTLRSDLEPREVLRLLERSTPACTRRPDLIGDVPFFCGRINARTGTFRLERNTWAKSRCFCPELRGRVRADGDGSIVDASITPGVGFWLGLLPSGLLLAFIPVGLTAWLLGAAAQPGSLFPFIVFPLFGVMLLWWMWGPVLFLNYSNLARYGRELSRLLNQMSQRIPDGRSVLEAEQTPEQAARKLRLRREAGRNALRLVALILALAGSASVGVGGQGWRTGQLTLHARSRPHQMHSQRQSVTLTGPAALRMAQGMVCGGIGVIGAGGVCWMLSRHDPAQLTRGNPPRPAWPPLETALLSVSVVLIVVGVGQGLTSLWQPL